MSPLIKLAIGAVVTAAGLLITFGAERQLIAMRECLDCEEDGPEAGAKSDGGPFLDTEDVEDYVNKDADGGSDD